MFRFVEEKNVIKRKDHTKDNQLYSPRIFCTNSDKKKRKNTIQAFYLKEIMKKLKRENFIRTIIFKILQQYYKKNRTYYYITIVLFFNTKYKYFY